MTKGELSRLRKQVKRLVAGTELESLYKQHAHLAHVNAQLRGSIIAIKEFWDNTDTPKAHFIGDTCDAALEIK